MSLFRAITVQQRPLLPRKVETRLPDCGVAIKNIEHKLRVDSGPVCGPVSFETQTVQSLLLLPGMENTQLVLSQFKNFLT